MRVATRPSSVKHGQLQSLGQTMHLVHKKRKAEKGQQRSFRRSTAAQCCECLVLAQSGHLYLAPGNHRLSNAACAPASRSGPSVTLIERSDGFTLYDLNVTLSDSRENCTNTISPEW